MKNKKHIAQKKLVGEIEEIWDEILKEDRDSKLILLSAVTFTTQWHGRFQRMVTFH